MSVLKSGSSRSINQDGLVGRPRVCPNSGFIDQLEVFERCNYQPSPTHEAYLLWKHERDAQVNNLLDTIDVVAVVPDLFFVIL